MKGQFLRRLMILSCFVAVAGLSGALPAKAQDGAEGKVQLNQDDEGDKPRVSIRPLVTFSSDHSLIYGGGSMLVRNNDGVYMSLNSFGLTPGTAVTAWWAFFNNPKQCATRPCSSADLSNPDAQASVVSATGRVVGADGTANFGAFRAVGDTTGANFGPGLINPKKAEIHLVIRLHGTAMVDNPDLLKEQLTTFNGGCPTGCVNVQVSVHAP